MTYGFAVHSQRPMLHIFDRQVTAPAGNVITGWKCGGRSVSDVSFSDEPNGLPPCIKCHGGDAHPLWDRVYFAQRGRRIKIGISRNPIARCSGLQARLLATIPGDARTEAAMHLAFGHLAVGGEWFRDAPELRALIARIEASEPQEVSA